MLRLSGVGKRHGRGTAILQDIDLCLPPGEATGIAGANGSGKSTLLRILAGVSRPSAGTIRGAPSVGYVPDRFPARQRMGARAYLQHMGRLGGLSTKSAKRRTDELLARLALAGESDTSLQALSKGNAQRVGVAQALLLPPELLVLDEPWSGLDAGASDVVAALMAEALASGTAVVFTDHRQDFTRRTASRPHSLVDGVLTPLRPSSAEHPHGVGVVLERTSSTPDTEWPTWTGVLDARTDETRAYLSVRADHRDALLLAALERGWLVVSVTAEECPRCLR